MAVCKLADTSHHRTSPLNNVVVLPHEHILTISPSLVSVICKKFLLCLWTCRTTETNQPVVIVKAFLCVWTFTVTDGWTLSFICSNISPDITVFTVCTFLRNSFPVVSVELSSSLRHSWWSRFLSFRDTNTERGDNWSPWGSFRASTKPHHPLLCTWKHNYACPPPPHTHAHIGTKTPPAVFDLVKQCMISGKILIQVHRGERDNRQWTQVRECVGVEVEVEVGPHPLCDTSIWMYSYFLSVYCLFDCGHFTISTCFMSSVSILEHEWLWLMTRQLSGSLSSTL